MNSKRIENNILNRSFTKKVQSNCSSIFARKDCRLYGYKSMNWYSIVLQKLVTRRPSVKLFRQNSRIFDTRGKTTDSGHIFWHSLLLKERNGIRRKVFGLFAALYHLEEWLNCHWKSVKVIFRVGGHFLYLLMAEQNNFWVLGFQAFQTNEYVWFTEVTVKSRVLVRLI